MNEKQKIQFLEMLAEQAPSLEVEDFSMRSAQSTLYQFLIFSSTIGLFSGLWNIIQFWVENRNLTTVKIKYTAKDDFEVEVEYSKLTMKQAEKILSSHSPKANSPVKIMIPRSE